MTKQERIEIINRSEKCILAIMVCSLVVIIIICVAFLPWSKPQECSQECFYNMTVEKSVYHFPRWDITLLAHENMSKISEVQLRYGEQWLEKHVVGVSLEEGDWLTIHFNLNVHIVSGEIFTMYLYFEHNDFMRINLTLPAEETT